MLDFHTILLPKNSRTSKISRRKKGLNIRIHAEEESNTFFFFSWDTVFRVHQIRALGPPSSNSLHTLTLGIHYPESRGSVLPSHLWRCHPPLLVLHLKPTVADTALALRWERKRDTYNQALSEDLPAQVVGGIVPNQNLIARKISEFDFKWLLGFWSQSVLDGLLTSQVSWEIPEYLHFFDLSVVLEFWCFLEQYLFLTKQGLCCGHAKDPNGRLVGVESFIGWPGPSCPPLDLAVLRWTMGTVHLSPWRAIPIVLSSPLS